MIEDDDTNDAVDRIIAYDEPIRDPSKTGNKPKELVGVEVFGYVCGRGKTRRVVFPNDVYRLANIGCTDREIALWFDMSESTLRYNFSEILEKGREDLKQSLRRAQLKLALNGNAVMLIWLGKNILGQQENPNTGDSTKVLPYKDDDTIEVDEDAT
jgi:hypothetical protein